MDKIQAFLVTSGRKDLAQEYFLKYTFHPVYEIWNDEILSPEDINKIKKIVSRDIDDDSAELKTRFSAALNRIMSRNEYLNQEPPFHKFKLELFYVEVDQPKTQHKTSINKYFDLICEDRNILRLVRSFVLVPTLKFYEFLEQKYYDRMHEKIASVLESRNIYKTKNYQELLNMGFEDQTTDRQWMNGSVDIYRGTNKQREYETFFRENNHYVLNISGSLTKKKYKHGLQQRLVYFEELKTQEDWDKAWGYLINYINKLEVKIQKNKDRNKQMEAEWEELYKKMNPKEYFSDEDFQKLKQELEKRGLVLSSSDHAAINIKLQIFRQMGTKKFRYIGIGTKDDLQIESMKFIKRINQYFNLLIEKGKTTVLEPLEKFKSIDFGKKLDDNHYNNKVFMKNINAS